LQFCRYAALVAALGARMILEVQPALAHLAGRPRRGQPGARARRAAATVRLPLPATEPAAGVRDHAGHDPGCAQLYGGGARQGGTVGRGTPERAQVRLAWSGNPVHKNDHNRSMSFEQFTHIVGDEHEFISLQKEHRESDLTALAANGKVRQVSAQLHDFTGTAALFGTLDLVIAVDTSIAHLAGALGKPVWILLPAGRVGLALAAGTRRQPIVPERAPVPSAGGCTAEHGAGASQDRRRRASLPGFAERWRLSGTSLFLVELLGYKST
jgi:hypothetical protein